MVKPAIRSVKESVEKNNLKPFDGLVFRNSKKGKSSELMTQEELDKRSRGTKLWDRFLIFIGIRPDYERAFHDHHIEEYSNIPWVYGKRNAKTRKLTIEHNDKKFSLTSSAVEELVLGLDKLIKTRNYDEQKKEALEEKSKLQEMMQGLFAHTSYTFQCKHNELDDPDKEIEEMFRGPDMEAIEIPKKFGRLALLEEEDMNASEIISALKDRAQTALDIDAKDLSVRTAEVERLATDAFAFGLVQIQCKNKKDGATHDIATASFKPDASGNLKLLIIFSEALQDASSKDQKNDEIEITLNANDPHPFKAEDFAQDRRHPLLVIMSQLRNKSAQNFLEQEANYSRKLATLISEAANDKYRNNKKALCNMRKNLETLRDWCHYNFINTQEIDEVDKTLEGYIKLLKETEQKPEQDDFPDSSQSKGEEGSRQGGGSVNEPGQREGDRSGSFSKNLAEERASASDPKKGNEQRSVPY